ncbi:MAG TPA: Fur family transcriptional regulator [Candidatus Limnocylindrales bacterium]|nr:Fur family transcriptional regulator [Candidatus Limnocylindrales bacterium]
MAGQLPRPWSDAPARLRRRGLRWTPQRQNVVEALAGTQGHLTGSELVELCRARDPQTIPSTVYRTLDALEELGLVRHGHGPDGREQYHVAPIQEHGHLYCSQCGGTWEITRGAADRIVDILRQVQDFDVDLSHMTVVGRCRTCRTAAG